MKSSAQLISEYGAEIDRTVAARPVTAQAIFDEAFKAPRPPRSDAYRKGCLWQLRYRMLEVAQYTCPYADSTAESDAFWAGVSEGWNLLALHKCDRRK